MWHQHMVLNRKRIEVHVNLCEKIGQKVSTTFMVIYIHINFYECYKEQNSLYSNNYKCAGNYCVEIPPFG